LHGVVRGTIGIDLILNWSLDNLEKLEKILKEMGLVSRLPVMSKEIFNFRDEYITNRNLIAWNFYKPSSPVEQVDIIITENLKGKKIKSVNIKGTNINFLAIKDLIKMKKKAGRPQDIEDAKALESVLK
jgi:hypothetical protein